MNDQFDSLSMVPKGEPDKVLTVESIESPFTNLEDDEQPVYGLYEVYAAQCTVALTDGTNRIHHDLVIARDDEHALALAGRSPGCWRSWWSAGWT